MADLIEIVVSVVFLYKVLKSGKNLLGEIFSRCLEISDIRRCPLMVVSP